MIDYKEITQMLNQEKETNSEKKQNTEEKLLAFINENTQEKTITLVDKESIKRLEKRLVKAFFSINPEKKSEPNFKSYEDIVTFLISEEVEKVFFDKHNIKLIDEVEAIFLAIACHREDMVDHLIKRGADLNCLDDSGASPLHCSIRQVINSENKGEHKSVQPKIMKKLFEAGAKVDIRTKYEANTPLHLTTSLTMRGLTEKDATADYYQIALMLLKKGADPLAENNDKVKPDMIFLLQYAKKHNKIEDLKFLISLMQSIINKKAENVKSGNALLNSKKHERENNVDLPIAKKSKQEVDNAVAIETVNDYSSDVEESVPNLVK